VISFCARCGLPEGIHDERSPDCRFEPDEILASDEPAEGDPEEGLDPEIRPGIRAESGSIGAAGPAPALAQALDGVEAFIARHVVFASEAQRVAVTLFAGASHAVERFDEVPYLHVTSAEKRSGKSRLLECLELVVRGPLRSSTISPAALFRLLEQEPHTVLLDECDSVFAPGSDRSELRGLLNAGYRRGAPAYRVEVAGKTLIPRAFEAFGFKVLAGIGALPDDTLADRCIPIRLRRRRPDEKVERFRYRDASREAQVLRERLAAAVAAVSDQLERARPEVPTVASDRAMDAWECLVAVADAAGGAWPQRARAALRELHGAEPETESAGVATLRAIREAFEQASTDRLATDELIRALTARDDGPWPLWWTDELERAEREGRPALKASRRLVRLLEPFGIRPRSIRDPDGRKRRGYFREDFADAWARYLPPEAAEAFQPFQMRPSGPMSPQVGADGTDGTALCDGGRTEPDGPYPEETEGVYRP
jgi:hypothetical protein